MSFISKINSQYEVNAVGSAPDAIFLDNSAEAVRHLDDVINTAQKLRVIFAKNQDLKARGVGIGIRDMLNSIADLLRATGDEDASKQIDNIKGTI